jgi:hypothetical protein
LVPKINNMLKQIGWCRTKVAHVDVEVGFFYFNLKCQNACNEWIYITFKLPLILDFVVAKVLQEKKRKFV